MKLQHITVIFIIIILPIILILSYYIQTQIDTSVLMDKYKTSLINSTHDAMAAFELNTMNNDYSESGESFRRDVQASINTFFRSMANNLGVSGYTKEYIEPYIPAIVFTGYDGCYIYAKTEQIDRYTKEEEKNGEGEEGDITDNPSSSEYNLKPFIYYSAQYNKGNIDVTINYTLDNYITVYGTIGSEYISESGYLLDEDTKNIINSINYNESLKENVKCIEKTASGNNIINIEDCEYHYTYNPLNKTLHKLYMDGTGYFQITSAGQISRISNEEFAKRYTTINDIRDLDLNNITKTYYLENNNIINQIYGENINFTNDIISKLGSIKATDMIVDDNGTRKKLVDVSEDNPYSNLKNNTNDIFDNDLVWFNEHKREIIKILIQENLKTALSNYQAGTVTTYRLPVLTETDWDNIFNNISMITFIQDMPVKYTTLNEYVIATSTGNKEYIPDTGIYFLDTDTNIYHKITCDKLKQAADAGHTIIGHKAIEFERNIVKNDSNTNQDYYYPHNASACYDCIVSSSSINLYNIDRSINVPSNLKEEFYSALAREKITQYKPTKWLSNY